MILLDAIATHIESAGLAGGATGWLLKKGFLPDDADQAVAIFETGGPAPSVMSDGSFFNNTFQIRVRGASFDYEGARAKIRDIMNCLHNADIPDFIYIYLLQSGPLPLGNDGNNRPNFTINFNTAWIPLSAIKSDYVTVYELLTASFEASHADSISAYDQISFGFGIEGNSVIASDIISTSLTFGVTPTDYTTSSDYLSLAFGNAIAIEGDSAIPLDFITTLFGSAEADSITTSDTVLFSAGFGGNNLSDGYGSTNFGR